MIERNKEELDQEINVISDPIQYRGKRQPSNKRYLSAIENHSKQAELCN